MARDRELGLSGPHKVVLVLGRANEPGCLPWSVGVEEGAANPALIPRNAAAPLTHAIAPCNGTFERDRHAAADICSLRSTTNLGRDKTPWTRR